MPAARGEKIVTSVPRSRWNLSCAPSRLARISSSGMSTTPLVRGCDRFSSAAICASLYACSAFGAVV